MANSKIRKPYDDLKLKIASDYFEFHVRMFVETYLWIHKKNSLGGSWDTVGNAMLEDFLIHARALIQFVQNPVPRKDDVIASDYFYDKTNKYSTLSISFLDDWANKIGSRLVHITTKPMPKLKSHQIWPIDDIVILLKPGLETFLNAVSESRLASDVRKDCLSHLAKLNPPKISVSVNVST